MQAGDGASRIRGVPAPSRHALAAIAALPALPAAAQAPRVFPDRPVQFGIPFGGGSATDTLIGAIAPIPITRMPKSGANEALTMLHDGMVTGVAVLEPG